MISLLRYICQFWRFLGSSLRVLCLPGEQTPQSSPRNPFCPCKPGRPYRPGFPEVPGGPGLPLSPGGPIIDDPFPGKPFGPEYPKSPRTPGRPGKPSRPGSPSSPGGPRIVIPGRPRSPIFPIGPAAPRKPIGPVGPCAPDNKRVKLSSVLNYAPLQAGRVCASLLTVESSLSFHRSASRPSISGSAWWPRFSCLANKPHRTCHTVTATGTSFSDGADRALGARHPLKASLVQVGIINSWNTFRTLFTGLSIPTVFTDASL